jgi:predicted component of type VI protein secretion system
MKFCRFAFALVLLLAFSSCSTNQFSQRKYLKGKFDDAITKVDKVGKANKETVEKTNETEDVEFLFASSIPEASGEIILPITTTDYLVSVAKEEPQQIKQEKELLNFSKITVKPSEIKKFSLLSLFELISFLSFIAAIVYFFLANPLWMVFAGIALFLFLLVKILSWIIDRE